LAEARRRTETHTPRPGVFFARGRSPLCPRQVSFQRSRIPVIRRLTESANLQGRKKMNTFRQIPRYIIRLLLLTVLAVVAMSVGAFLAWMGWNALFSAISLMIPALRDPNVQITRGNVSQSVGLFIGQGGLIFALSLGAGVSLALTHWFTSLRSMVPLRNWLFASALGFLIATPFGLNFLAAFGGTPG